MGVNVVSPLEGKKSSGIRFMNVFIFGATGYIGNVVARAAVGLGWNVRALARSDKSALHLRSFGAHPVLGELSDPETWSSDVATCDVVVQLAAAFDGDLCASDSAWTNAMIKLCQHQRNPIRVIYTGGCWLYPARVDPPVTEADKFDPLPPFEYMVENRARLHAAGIQPVTVHPAMVWSESGGCIANIEAAIELGVPVGVVGSLDVRWPLVHVNDLATLYILAARYAPPGTDYFGVADPGIAVREIVRSVERSKGKVAELCVIPVAQAVGENGPWAAGYGRSQSIQTDLASRMIGWRPQHHFAGA